MRQYHYTYPKKPTLTQQKDTLTGLLFQQQPTAFTFSLFRYPFHPRNLKSSVMKRRLFVSLLFLWLYQNGFTQSVNDKLKINDLIDSKQVTAYTSPFDNGVLKNVFDGDQYTFAKCDPTHNPMLITLKFENKIYLSKSRIASLTPAQWTIEIANTMADMTSQSNSYRKLFNGEYIEANMYYTQPFTASGWVVRLTLNRTTSNYHPHLGEWELYGSTTSPIPASIEVAPASQHLKVNSTLQLQAYGKTETGGIFSLSGSALTWVSTDSNVATVSATGLVTAKTNGKSSIKAVYTYDGKTVMGSAEMIVDPTGISCK